MMNYEGLKKLEACMTAAVAKTKVHANTAAELWAEIRGETDAAMTSRNSASSDMAELCAAGVDEAGKIALLRDGDGSGIPTGIAPLDSYLGGILPGKLYVVAARTAVGKTALLLQMAMHAAHRHYRVGFLALEMTKSDMFFRMAANRLDVSLSGIMRGNLSCAERVKTEYVGSPMATYAMHINDSAFTLDACAAQAARWKVEEKIDIVMLDYIGLITVPGAENRVAQLGIITRRLKLLSKTLDIPIVIAAQLSRAAVGQRPDLHHLRESGDIEQNADVVIMLHAPDDDDRGCREIGVLKNRMGQAGWSRVALRFDGDKQRFVS